MEGYGCVLAFDTSDPEFARGVEIGRLWERLRHDDEEVVELIHCSNAEMALRVAEASGRTVRSEELSDTWLELTLGPADSLSEAEPRGPSW